MERPVLVIVGIKANLSQMTDWFGKKRKEEWNLIFPLMRERVAVGVLSLTFPLWGQVQTGERSSEEAQKAVWGKMMLIPLCKMVLIVEKRKSVVRPIDTFAKGIRLVIMLPQVSKLILGFKEMLMLVKMG